jgi:hypothetical protein
MGTVLAHLKDGFGFAPTGCPADQTFLLLAGFSLWADK